VPLLCLAECVSALRSGLFRFNLDCLAALKVDSNLHTTIAVAAPFRIFSESGRYYPMPSAAFLRHQARCDQTWRTTLRNCVRQTALCCDVVGMDFCSVCHCVSGGNWELELSTILPAWIPRFPIRHDFSTCRDRDKRLKSHNPASNVHRACMSETILQYRHCRLLACFRSSSVYKIFFRRTFFWCLLALRIGALRRRSDRSLIKQDMPDM
jgi:hypothetical protein